MGRDPQPAALTPLLGEDRRPLTAAEAVERTGLWMRAPADGRTAGPKGGPAAGGTTGVRVILNMASTADGRASLGGRSGPIGGRGDRELFHALRAAVDAVLVGAGTVRAERYGRIVRDEASRRLRLERGLEEEPLACIVSAGLDLPPDIPLLGDPAARVVVLTPSPSGEIPSRDTAAGGPSGAGAAVAGAGAPVEYIRVARDGALDLPAALAELRERFGVRTVLCEGGPRLNGALFAAGIVDELFLSLAPKLGGGGNADAEAAPRIVQGPDLDPPVELELLDVLRSGSELLLRYGVAGSPPAGPSAV
jgi:riboflavin biosynthesis pyrimidine reductase